MNCTYRQALAVPLGAVRRKILNLSFSGLVVLALFPFGLVALVATPFLVVSIDSSYPYGKVVFLSFFSSSFSSLV